MNNAKEWRVDHFFSRCRAAWYAYSDDKGNWINDEDRQDWWKLRIQHETVRPKLLLSLSRLLIYL